MGRLSAFLLPAGPEGFQRLTALVALDNVGNRTVYDQCGLPQPGRTLRFGLTLG